MDFQSICGKERGGEALGNILCFLGYVCQYGFRYYTAWEAVYQDWYNLILYVYVKGQVTNAIVGHSCTTIAQIIPVYAPSSARSNEAAYIAAIEYAVAVWRSGKVYLTERREARNK